MKCPNCHFDNPVDTRFCGKCGIPFAPSEEIPLSRTETLQVPMRELTLGSTFAGRYHIIEELGRGGMGKVYKVVDKEIKERVALKILNPEIAANEDTIERFRNELKLARKVSHKNVCRMHDLRKERGTYYITMEYVSGEDLKSTIRRMGQLSVGKAIFIAKQVCEGLAEAHRLGVVHRDLKSKNIMIDKQGNARIMDFGIARSMETKGITEAGMMIGTPDYMSPEQVEGKEADQRSDIYSLGVIFYEMVTGRVPFSGDNPLSIALKHKTEAPPDPRELNDQLPEDLSRLILRCMEKDKRKRYQGAEELLSELNKIERGIPTTEKVLPRKKPITTREITVKFNLKKLFIPALVVIAVAISVVITWQLIPKKERKPINIEAEKFYKLGKHFLEEYTNSRNEEHFKKAVENYEKAVEIDPNYAKAYWSLGNAYESHLVDTLIWTDVPQMLDYYKKAHEIDPNLAEANEGLAWAYFYSGDLDRAYQHYKKALETDPNNPSILFTAGTFLNSVGLYSKAIEYFTKSLELRPTHIMAYRNCAKSYMCIGEFLKAANLIKKGLEIEPDNVGLYVFYATQLIMMKKYDEAEKELARVEKVVSDAPNIQLTIQLNRALIFAIKGEKEEALALIKDIKYEDHYHFKVTSIYSLLGMKDEAIKYISEGIDRGFRDYLECLYSYPTLRHFPFYENLRGDPLFEEIVKIEKEKYEDKLKKWEATISQ